VCGGLEGNCNQRRLNKGGDKREQLPGRRTTAGAPKSPNSVKTVNFLPKELKFEHGGR